MRDTSALDDSELQRLARDGDRKVATFAGEVLRLRWVIQNHMSKRDHELCWLNDLELWREIEPRATYPHESLPL